VQFVFYPQQEKLHCITIQSSGVFYYINQVCTAVQKMAYLEINLEIISFKENDQSSYMYGATWTYHIMSSDYKVIVT
jgi:hypothetical protein